jgi:heme/copper-type cytochrome/quinol oxidase subunit 2
MSIVNVLICIFIIIYFLHTLLFAIEFNKTDTFYTKKQKQRHNILIWTVPFLWIILLKAIAKPTPGSSYFKNKRQSKSSSTYEERHGTSGFSGLN